MNPGTGPSPTSTETAVDPQRRVLTVLVTAQVFSGAGLAAGITVGALLAERMLGSTGLAGLPSALFTLGSALAALAVGRISQSRGRRPGLATGYAIGALGAFGVVAAAALDNPGLLFLALFVYGAGTATNLQARYAGADLAAPTHRGRAISIVLVATTLGGVVGPNLATTTDTLATGIGLPTLTGPFVLAGVAYAAAAVVLAALLRPDPLLRARQLQTAGHDDRDPADAPTAAPPAPTSSPWRSTAIVSGAAIMVATQVVMVAIMTMTPVHITGHGHGVGAAGLIIGIHVAAMYLPSPLSGWITDRYGVTPAAVIAGISLVVAGLLAALAPPESLAALGVALALLGFGWNIGLLAGTTTLSTALDPTDRARTQGTVDVAVALGGAVGGLGSGLVVAAASYAILGILGAGLAALVLPVAVAVARRGITRTQGPS